MAENKKNDKKKERGKIKKDKTKKEKFVEFFKIKKKGKEKTVKKEGEISEEVGDDKKTAMNENKILAKIFITLAILIIVIFGVYYGVQSSNTFEYKGVKYERVMEGDLLLYNTKLPVVMKDGGKAEYNFYLRNDPRKLEDIKFNGNLNMLPLMVINATDNLNCDGDGVIGIANLKKLYEISNTRVIKDTNASCEASEGDYMYLNIIEGNESVIRKTGSACYELEVNNCEILPVTEKFMVETFSKINQFI